MAESRGTGGHGVVQAPREVEGHLCLASQKLLGAVDRRTGNLHPPFVDSRKDGVVSCSQSMYKQIGNPHSSIGEPKDLQVSFGVKTQCLLLGGLSWFKRADRRGAREAVGLYQIVGKAEAIDLERMERAEVIAQ